MVRGLACDRLRFKFGCPHQLYHPPRIRLTTVQLRCPRHCDFLSPLYLGNPVRYSVSHERSLVWYDRSESFREVYFVTTINS